MSNAVRKHQRGMIRREVERKGYSKAGRATGYFYKQIYKPKPERKGDADEKDKG